MTDEFKTDVLRYLLGELDAEARAAFEERLARDPAVRDELRLCADAVARFASETAPAEAMSPPVQRAVLSDVLAKVAREPRRPRSQWGKWRLVLPLAAAVAFGFLLVRLLPTKPDPIEPRVVDAHKPAVAVANGSPLNRQDGAEKNATTGTTPAPAETIAARDRLVEEAKQLGRLRLEHAALERAHEELKGKYATMQRQLSVIAADGGRLTAIELVDSQSYERGEHKGLVDLARGLLTEPGLVAISPVVPTSPQTPPDNTPPPPTGGVGITETEPEPTDSSGGSTTPEPYAWSVYDESAKRGYLNLYNLPVTPADQTLLLWVKESGSTTYQKVGTVPAQYYGGSGSVYYTLPATSRAPAEILITREPKAATPAQPTGKVLLRGP